MPNYFVNEVSLSFIVMVSVVEPSQCGTQQISVRWFDYAHHNSVFHRGEHIGNVVDKVLTLYEENVMTIIELPEEFHNKAKDRVRVIIFSEDTEEEEDMVEFLLKHPYSVTKFVPLTRDEMYERQ